MRPDFRTFQYTSRAKTLIHHYGRTDRKGRIDKKQAYMTSKGSDKTALPRAFDEIQRMDLDEVTNHMLDSSTTGQLYMQVKE